MYKMSEKSLSKVSTAHSDVFKLLLLYDQQPKTQRYSIYNDAKQRKQQILIFDKLEPANVQHFCYLL